MRLRQRRNIKPGHLTSIDTRATTELLGRQDTGSLWVLLPTLRNAAGIRQRYKPLDLEAC
jgi:hypothetical protein